MDINQMKAIVKVAGKFGRMFGENANRKVNVPNENAVIVTISEKVSEKDFTAILRKSRKIGETVITVDGGAIVVTIDTTKPPVKKVAPAPADKPKTPAKPKK